MLQFLIPLALLASTADCYHPFDHAPSAASAAQIRFAVENKYDDTGPGSKQPEYAYHTYKNLDDALVAYLDDPDTKLPEHEKARAIANLYRSTNHDLIDDVPTRVDSFTGNRQKVVPIVLSTYNKVDFKPKPSVFEVNIIHPTRKEPFKWQKQQAVKASPLSISHYNKDVEDHLEYKSDPGVYNSYNVQNSEASEPKSHQQLRDGSDAIYGYYTVTERGRHRTVHYHGQPAGHTRVFH